MAAVLVAACGESASVNADAAQQDATGDGMLDAPPDWCGARTALTGGTACAIAPSITAAGTSDAFGYHAIGLPASATASTPLFIFFKGTGSKPFDPTTNTYLGSTLLTLQEAIDHGRIGLIVAYDNAPALDVICGDDLDCYGAVRLEILEGVEAGDPGDVKHVRPPDDATSRIANLLAYASANMPGAVPLTVDWTTTRVGGGSQGGGHAAFIGKQLHAVPAVCNLAGLGDGAVTTSDAATWVTATPTLTPIANMRAVIHEQDPYFARATSAWSAFGFQLDVNWRTISGATSDPHNFVVTADPVAVAARLWACYE